MACSCATEVVALLALIEVGRVADDAVVLRFLGIAAILKLGTWNLKLFQVILERYMLKCEAVGEGGVGKVDGGIEDGIVVDVDGSDLCLRKTLRHHEGDDTSTCSDVEDILSSGSKSAEQVTVCAYFHRCMFLHDVELFVSEEVLATHVNILALLLLPLRCRHS